MSSKAPKDVRAIMLDGTAIQRAQRESWIKTLDRHERLGNPIVVWRDGKVVWIPAEEIVIPVTAPCDEGSKLDSTHPGCTDESEVV
jgi:hypothetical protein